MKKLILTVMIVLNSIYAMALESDRVPITQFTFSLYCQNKEYWQSNVSFNISGSDRPFVWARPDENQMKAGSVSFLSKNNQYVELAQIDVHEKCMNLTEQNGRSSAFIDFDLGQDLTAAAFITWDEKCRYGVWGWGDKRGWISTAYDRSVVLNAKSSVIQLEQRHLRSLPFEPVNSEAECRKKAKELVESFPNW